MVRHQFHSAIKKKKITLVAVKQGKCVDLGIMGSLDLPRLGVFAKEILPVGPAQSSGQARCRLGLWRHSTVSYPLWAQLEEKIKGLSSILDGSLQLSLPSPHTLPCRAHPFQSFLINQPQIFTPAPFYFPNSVSYFLLPPPFRCSIDTSNLIKSGL